MLLALFADFWTFPWPTGPGPLPDGGAKGAGHGGFDGIPQVPAIPDGAYFRANDDYWEAREQFLIRNRPAKVPEVARDIPDIVEKIEKHNRAIELAARVHTSRAHLINLEAILKDVMKTVADRLEEQAMDDEAVEILLLM